MSFFETMVTIGDPRGCNLTDLLAGFLSSVLLAALSGANSTGTVTAFPGIR